MASPPQNLNDRLHQPLCLKQRILPKCIILVRHGESEGNIDESAYATTPDYKVPLTPLRVDQANRAGSDIRHVVCNGGVLSNWKVYFYVPPYQRPRLTLREIGRAFPKRRIIWVREECRIREQDFGNFQIAQRMKVIKETREVFGRFFYRFPEGESAADVYDRVSIGVGWRLQSSNLSYRRRTTRMGTISWNDRRSKVAS